MRNRRMRALLVVLGALIASGAEASPVGESPPDTEILAPYDAPDRAMPEIPADDPLVEERNRDERGGAVVRVPPDQIPVVEYDPAKLVV